jgi:hypothetical protein
MRRMMGRRERNSRVKRWIVDMEEEVMTLVLEEGKDQEEEEEGKEVAEVDRASVKMSWRGHQVEWELGEDEAEEEDSP